MDFIYNNKILNPQECDFIKNYILENEDYMKSLGPDVYPGTSDDSLTGRYRYLNMLHTPIGDILLPKLKNIFKELDLHYPVTIQSWANTFRNGEGIAKHVHGHYTNTDTQKYISGNLFVSGPTSIGTWYGSEKYENEAGFLTLFPCDTSHYVPENTTDDVRISIAIDISSGTKPPKSGELQSGYYEGRRNNIEKTQTKRFYVIEEPIKRTKPIPSNGRKL